MTFSEKIKKLENYLAQREKNDTQDFHAHPVRWMVLSSLIIPVAAFGIVLAGGGSETGTILIAVALLAVAQKINRIGKEPGVKKIHRFVGFISLILALCLAVYILVAYGTT